MKHATNAFFKFYLATALTFVAILFAACSGSDTDDGGSALSVTMSGSKTVELAKGGQTEVNFYITPAATDISYSSGGYNAKLCYVSTKSGVAEAYISEVTFVGNGHYKATIEDRGGDKSYQINVCIVITTTDNNSAYTDAFSLQNSKPETGITMVNFLKSNNPSLEKDLYCEFDSKTNTFSTRSSKLIDVKALTATFVASGNVKIGTEAQQSGITKNDFSKDVTYTVSDGSKTKTYTVKVVNFTGLPVVYINSSTRKTPIKNDITSKTDWKAATIQINGNGKFEDMASTAIELRGRGNITWGWDKKAFNFKFEERTKVLGMPKHKRWVMLANYADRTMIRNDVAFHVSGLTSLEWAPRGEYVELYYNGEYTGTYYLVEQVRVDKNRVNIHEQTPAETDISGGYLVELDFHGDSSPWQWKTSTITNFGDGSIYLVKYPDEDEIIQSQFDYIKGYIKEFEATIKDSNKLSDPNNGYKKYIEPLSFIDYWLIYEVCINHEILNPGSVYVHKDQGGKLVAGPIWDFDYGTFNFDYYEAKPAANNDFFVNGAIWYRYLFVDKDMRALAKKRWTELRPKLLTVPAYMQQEADYLRYAAEENFKKWPMTITTNGDSQMSYDGAVVKMQSVFKNRIEKIDMAMENW